MAGKWEGPRGTLIIPEVTGGANWQGGSFDPETKRFYIFTNVAIASINLAPPDEGRSDMLYVRGNARNPIPPAPAAAGAAPAPGAGGLNVRGLPLIKPPYGTITALDMNKGELLWMTPNGDGPRDHPLLKPLNLPPLGNPGRSSPLVTKTLVFLGEGDPGMAALGSRLRPEMPRTLAPGWGGRKFRAFDKATGAILWETELPSGVTGAPMTYMFDGKQYIVAAIGNTEEERAGFVALSLP